MAPVNDVAFHLCHSGMSLDEKLVVSCCLLILQLDYHLFFLAGLSICQFTSKLQCVESKLHALHERCRGSILVAPKTSILTGSLAGRYKSEF